MADLEKYSERTRAEMAARERIRAMPKLPGDGGKGRRAATGTDASGLRFCPMAELRGRIESCPDRAILAHYADIATYRVGWHSEEYGFVLFVTGSGGKEFIVAATQNRWGRANRKWEAEWWVATCIRVASARLGGLDGAQARRAAALAMGDTMGALLNG